MKFQLLVALAAIVVSHSVWAASTVPQGSASCYVPLNDPKNIKGENLDQRLPIASVSKLITSYWAIKEKSVNYRFQTVLHLTPVGNQLFDMHIQGSRDPYFGAQRLHYMISELNKRGITKIRNLSFDEEFKFMWSIDDRRYNGNSSGQNYAPDEPRPAKVLSQLRAYGKLTQDYADSLAWAKKNNVSMVETPAFEVNSIEFIAAQNFDARSTTRVYRVYSIPLVNILKEMNRNSHNLAANLIFEHLEQDEKFSQFIFQDLGLTKDTILMRNGSGDSVAVSGGPYNEVSCASVLKIMMAMYNELKDQKSSFTRVATVVGTNDGNATALYNNPQTFDFVAAKTGTVNPNVALGGVASTNKGLVFFFFNMKSSNSAQARNNARAQIRKNLLKLMTDFNGGVRLKAQSFAFIGFDSKSFGEIKTAEVLP